MAACPAVLKTGFDREEGEDWVCGLAAGHQGAHRAEWEEGTKTNYKWEPGTHFSCAIEWTEAPD